MKSKYHRVLIKLSGEALGGENSSLDYDQVDRVAGVLKELHEAGVEMGVVIGGGNIFRGRSGREINRTDADHMGMLATAINALALKDALLRINTPACVISAIEMHQICDTYSQRAALGHLQRGEIVIFACGIGRPYFSTDTASAMRALEIGAQVLLCGKNVDGVYSADPNIDPNAVRYEHLKYDDVIGQNLQALDQSAITLCRDHGMPIFVFELRRPEKLIDAITGDAQGTYIGA